MRATRAARPCIDIEQLTRLVREGSTLSQMARSLGVTGRTVSRYKRTYGLTQAIGGARVLPPSWEAQAAQLLDEGYSQAAVAEMAGVSTSTVAKYFPGRGWSSSQCGAHAQLARTLNRIQTAA